MPETEYKTTKDEDMAVIRAMNDFVTKSLATQIKDRKPSVTEYQTERGVIFGFALLDKPGITVQDAFASKGAELAEHKHLVKEWMIVYEGCCEVMQVTPDGNMVKILDAGDSIYIEAGVIHTTRFTTDTRMLAITVPADGGYPHARGGE